MEDAASITLSISGCRDGRERHDDRPLEWLHSERAWMVGGQSLDCAEVDVLVDASADVI